MPGVSKTMVGLLVCLGESDTRFLSDSGVLCNTAYVILRQQVRKNPLGYLPVFKHITYTTGCAQVIFQYIKGPIIITNQVNTRNMDINIMRYLEVVHFSQVVRTAIDHISRYQPIIYNKLVAVHIFKKRLSAFKRCLMPRSI